MTLTIDAHKKWNGWDPDKLYYLASPYSNPDNTIRDQNAADIDEIAAILIRRYKLALIEPITMCHHKAIRFLLPGGFDYWKKRDLLYIDHCDAIIVAKMNGWEKSVGVAAEIQHAKEMNKPVYYLNVSQLKEEVVE